MEKAQECMEQANKGMLGSNGEKLKIVIKDTPKTNSCSADTIEISVGSKGHRSHARKYESDIDCPTITHEVLHLLGLCDEYKESIIGIYVNSKTGDIKHSISLDNDEKKRLVADEGYEFKPAYNCRVIQGDNNVMSNPSARWRFVFGINEDQEIGDSLLTPAQFNSILYGGCSQKNKIFNECSQLAYMSSDSDKDQNCIEKRNRCESQNIHGIDKQEEIERLKKRIEFHARIRDRLNKQAGFIGDKSKLSGFKPELAIGLLPADSESKSLMQAANAEFEDLSDSAKAEISKKQQAIVNRYRKERLDYLNICIDFQNKTVDDLKRRLKGVKSWPDP